MKSVQPLILVALALFACGGGSSGATPRTGSTAGSKSATADTKAGSKAASGETAGLAADESEPKGVNELMHALDDLPTQDQLDAAAAARISEANADSEYEKLKAEIEKDAQQPAEDAGGAPK